jgi:hypothetical protein
MAADLGVAQNELSASLIDLRGSTGADPALITQSEQQLALILSLKGQLAAAGPKQLAAISSQIATAISAAASTANQAQQAAAAGISSGGGSMASASQAARETVNEFEDAYFKQHKFDAYLQFKSAEDERAFHEREAQRQAEIERARAQHTPEGDKRALDLSLAQLDDAGAHGADKSPDFEPMRKKMQDANTALAAQIDQTKGKARSTAQATPDPLDSLEPSASVSPDLLAKFKATGVVVADQTGTGHGITTDASQDRTVRLPS